MEASLPGYGTPHICADVTANTSMNTVANLAIPLQALHQFNDWTSTVVVGNTLYRDAPGELLVV